MKNVLLIHASLPEIGNIRKRRRALFPSLALTHVAALFPADYRITLINDIVEDVPFERGFDLVGITFYGIAMQRAFAIAKRFRERGVPVVFGGPVASATPDVCRPHCDSLIVGEVEGIMPRFISDFEAGRLAPEYVAAGQPSIAHLPVPRYDLLDRRHYSGIYPVQTARGCVFRCSYCSIPALNNYTVRYRPLDEVVRDIEAATAASGTRQVFFVDDNINMNPRRSIELFKALIPLKIEWYSYGTSLIAKQPEVLRLAAESGCRVLFVGFESLSAEKLKDANKAFNRPHEYRRDIETIHGHGIHIMPAFIFGLDGDEAGVFRQTYDFLQANRLSIPVFHILTPVPGTATFDELSREKRILDPDVTRFSGGRVVFEPRGMTAGELEHGAEWILRSIYSIRSILRRCILRVPIGGWRRWRTQLLVTGINFHYWRLVRQRFFAARA